MCKNNVFSRVVIKIKIFQSCCTRVVCLALVSLVSLVSHSCWTCFVCTSLVSLVSGTRVVKQTRLFATRYCKRKTYGLSDMKHNFSLLPLSMKKNVKKPKILNSKTRIIQTNVFVKNFTFLKRFIFVLK